jgi:membrane protein implicated in regulation of membrane protease activity
MVVQRQECAV